MLGASAVRRQGAPPHRWGRWREAAAAGGTLTRGQLWSAALWPHVSATSPGGKKTANGLFCTEILILFVVFL